MARHRFVGCHLRVGEWGEHLVPDHDRGKGPAADVGIVGGDGGDGFADETHHSIGKDGLVGADQAVGGRARYVGGRDHRMHPGHVCRR